MAGEPGFTGTDGGEVTGPGASRQSTCRGRGREGRQAPAPLRHGARRMRRHRRLVRRQRQGHGLHRGGRATGPHRGGSEELTRTPAAMIARCEPRRSGSCPPASRSSTGTPSRATTAGWRPGPSRWCCRRSSLPPSSSARRETAAGVWLLVALVFGLLGDVALLSDSLPRFRAGVWAFLVGHLAYLVCFASLGLTVPAWSWSGWWSWRSP